jgi:predicted TIM-barrel fold metal-dependent hydrolase
MIDMHIHVVSPNLPGAGLLGEALTQPIEALADQLRHEMRQSGMEIVLGMGCLGAPDEEEEGDPLGIAGTLEIARRVPGLAAIGAMDPRRTSPEHLRAVERQIQAGGVKALKGYLGYLHFGPEHPGYRPYYELAERFRLPVIFHTGDTYSPRAKLRYAHPLLVDEVAVDHPGVRFVLAHVGNPWLIDAAEVIYKNLNVWADISGLAVGDAAAFAADDRQEALAEVLAGVRKAFRYAERPNRFLYGSDWPLAPLEVYRSWVAQAIPEIYHEQVFEENARALFRL